MKNHIIIFIITIGTLLGTVYVFGFFAPPLSTALIHEASNKLNETNLDDALSKISGSYTGTNYFIIALGQATASLIMGFTLIGSNKENPINFHSNQFSNFTENRFY